MTDILVIVDMQSDYPAARLPSLIRRIERAAEEFQGEVLAINYEGSGACTVKLDPDAAVLWKNRNDGGGEVCAWLLGRGLVSRDLRLYFCGVNAVACVLDTAVGTASRLREEHGFFGLASIVLDLSGDDNRLITMRRRLPGKHLAKSSSEFSRARHAKVGQ